MIMNRTTDTWRQHALMLAIFACVLRALIPVGFMPGVNTTMVICSGMEGQKTVAVGDHDPSTSPAAKAGKDTCAFSVNASGLAAGGQLALAPFTPVLPPVIGTVQSHAPHVFFPYGSRAPPLV